MYETVIMNSELQYDDTGSALLAACDGRMTGVERDWLTDQSRTAALF